MLELLLVSVTSSVVLKLTANDFSSFVYWLCVLLWYGLSVLKEEVNTF